MLCDSSLQVALPPHRSRHPKLCPEAKPLKWTPSGPCIPCLLPGRIHKIALELDAFACWLQGQASDAYDPPAFTAFPLRKAASRARNPLWPLTCQAASRACASLACCTSSARRQGLRFSQRGCTSQKHPQKFACLSLFFQSSSFGLYYYMHAAYVNPKAVGCRHRIDMSTANFAAVSCAGFNAGNVKKK